MRLRLPELLEERGRTAYEVVKASGGRVDASSLYRLIRKRGVVRYIDAQLVETLCELLDADLTEVVELEGHGDNERTPKSGRRPRKK